jgi:hypothetical protein
VRRAFALHDRLMLERTVFKPEAVNRAAVSNCIKALRDMSVLVQLDRKKFMVSPEYARGGRLEALADHVYRFMVKEPPELRDEAAVEGR